MATQQHGSSWLGVELAETVNARVRVVQRASRWTVSPGVARGRGVDHRAMLGPPLLVAIGKVGGA